MSASRLPTAAVLRAEALADFRLEVEHLALPVDWERVRYRRGRCKRFGHKLGRPEIQYKKQSGDRGRWFIVCRHDHTGDIQGGGSLFEFVSEPLPAADLLFLRDVKAASDAAIKDVLASRRRSISIRTRRNSAAASTYNTRSTYMSAVPLAPRQARQLGSRPRSPSVEVLAAPPILTFDIYVFHKKKLSPFKVQIPIDCQTFMVRLGRYDRIWEAAGVKLADTIQLLVFSDLDGASPFWASGRVCDVSVPASCGPLVVACEGVAPAPPLLRGYYQYACDVDFITF
ncbi:hypothetical protein PENSPDRAFT_690267 [Peniophora sp. CONT]|nr:hypothetical protein PENSPDRAFT_690267 [Peniophora sp. CONT]